jgi:hypothetical protein
MRIGSAVRTRTCGPIRRTAFGAQVARAFVALLEAKLLRWPTRFLFPSVDVLRLLVRTLQSASMRHAASQQCSAKRHSIRARGQVLRKGALKFLEYDAALGVFPAVMRVVAHVRCRRCRRRSAVLGADSL